MQKRTRLSDEDAFGTEDASGLTDLLQRAFEIRKPYLTARDFRNETLVTYPIPDERLDLVRDVLTRISIPRGERPN